MSSEVYGSTEGTITHHVLDQTQTLPEQMEQLYGIFYDGSVVGTWDTGSHAAFWRRSLRAEGMPQVEGVTWICVIQMAKKLLSGLKDYNLDTVTDHLLIPRNKAKEHRAGEDVRVLCLV